MTGLFTLATVVANLFAASYVSSILWVWFLTPLGLPAIAMAHCMGLMCLGAAFRSSTAPRAEREDEEDGAIRALSRFMGIWFALLVGWLAHLAMVTP